jgi:NAD(P)H-hydrate epimerase
LPQPLVIDAVGLNALAAAPRGLAHAGGPRILTPHPGEFARLSPGDENQAERAVEMARALGLIVVLKGPHTLVTNGQEQFRNTTGNPGLATGGTGDVLTGIITALVCQGLAPFAAAKLGVFVHGLAGDLAAEKLGQVGMTARDVVDQLPNAWKKMAE